jgi:hypothetical protein
MNNKDTDVELGTEIQQQTATVPEAVEPTTEHPEEDKWERIRRDEAQRVVKALVDLTALGIIEWRFGKREAENWARACVNVHLRKTEYLNDTDRFLFVANEHELDERGYLKASQFGLNSGEYNELADAIYRYILINYDYDVYNESQ